MHRGRESTGEVKPCEHPEARGGWCWRTSPCETEVCQWAADQVPPQITNVITDIATWSYLNNEEKTATLVSPCGRFQIIRVILTEFPCRLARYTLCDQYPTDGSGLPTIKGVADSARDALKFLPSIG